MQKVPFAQRKVNVETLRPEQIVTKYAERKRVGKTEKDRRKRTS